MTSPSCTSYSLPSTLRRPFDFALASEPHSMRVFHWMTSARMKPRSKSEWMTPAAPGAKRAAADGPGAALLFARSEVGDQVEQRVGLADESVEAGLFEAEAVEELVALLGFESSDLRLDGGRDHHHFRVLFARVLDERLDLRILESRLELILGDVGHVEHRLGRQQGQIGDVATLVVSELEGAETLAVAEAVVNLGDRRQLGLGLLVAASSQLLHLSGCAARRTACRAGSTRC